MSNQGGSVGGRGSSSYSGGDAGQAKISDYVNDFLDNFGEKAGAVAVSDNERELSEDDIIEKISGLDMTEGSCVSLAIAYAANKAGLDVEDLRGGESQKVFSRHADLALNSLVGDENFTSARESTPKAKWSLIKNAVEPGQEYIVTAGGSRYGHAAVVRKNGRSYEYLELQTGVQDGWKSLTEASFAKRFNVPKRSKYSTAASVAPISAMVEDKESLRAIASLLNTAG